MKYLIIFLFLFLISYNLSAQTLKGSFLVGGNVTANYSDTESQGAETKSSSLDIDPKAGFFIMDNLSLGALIPFTFGKSRYSYSGMAFPDAESSTTSIGFGPFIRYYFPINNLKIITELGYSWNESKTNTIGYDQQSGQQFDFELNTNQNKFQVASGIALFLSESAAIEFLINYQNTDSETESKEYFFVNEFKQNQFFFKLCFSILDCSLCCICVGGRL